jgi:hypothetical protein
MSEEFESLNSRIPDFGAAIAQKIAARSTESGGQLPPPGTVDPYKLMLQRKQGITSDPVIPTVPEWPAEQVNKLQDYCAKMGIVGFNSGRMSPLAALAMLKKQFGDDYTDVPLEERVPAGYEKIGIKSPYGPSYPYSQAVNQRRILHG